MSRTLPRTRRTKTMALTQLYLDDELTRAIADQARRRGQTKAAVIRRLIETGLERERSESGETIGQAFLGLAALGERLGLREQKGRRRR